MAAPAVQEHEPEDARSVITQRLLNAPRELVFEVFTDTRHLSRWYGPEGFSITTRTFDFREGGVWRFVMHGPDGRDYQNRVVFDVIDPPARLVNHHDGGVDGAEEVYHTMVITLEPEGDKTRLIWRVIFASIAERDRMARDYGVVEGGQQNAARLAAYVEGLA